MTASRQLWATDTASGGKVWASLSWQPSDPLAVQLDLRGSLTELVSWRFAVDLLFDGLSSVAGVGDVQVCPQFGRSGWTLVRLDNGRSRIVLMFTSADLTAFLDEVWVAEQPVPDCVPDELVTNFRGEL